MRHCRIILRQCLVFSLRHNRIHKKTAGITHHFRVGQLRIPYVCYHPAQFRRRRSRDTSALQLRTDIAVFITRHIIRSLTQPISNVRYKIFIFPFVLETALPISVSTILISEYHNIAGRYLHRLHTTDKVFSFLSVGADILYRTRSHLTGNHGKVLQSVHAMLHTESHDIIPDFAGTATQHDAVALFICNFDAPYGRMHYNAVKILRKQQIATATDNQERRVFPSQDISQPTRLVHRLILYKATARSLNPKCIICQQAITVKILHSKSSYTLIFTSFHSSSVLRKTSSVSKPLAMPLNINIFSFPPEYFCPYNMLYTILLGNSGR